ncbi:hypothetical protein CLPUN_32430 [Clostridium puniceum]|uniref:Uncharacterized protein n=1 Tax=Clostridium puniceum TaxID=29367 RepID=A0A1S8TCT6_9CLOT|nr:hypothetical protein CLPUN_32430 [Clostridium puniceum]
MEKILTGFRISGILELKVKRFNDGFGDNLKLIS